MRTPGTVAFIKIRLKSAHRGHRTISFAQILQDPISSHIGWFQMHSKRRHERFICFVVSSANPNNLKFIRVDLLFSRNDWLINHLVYTKTVDSVFRALWLATQSVNFLHYSLIHLQFLLASDAKLAWVSSKMPSRFAAVTNKEIHK